MAIIEIGNVYCKVKDASLRSTLVLSNALSVITPGHEFSTSFKRGFWDGMTGFYENRGKKFPTGLLSEAVLAMRKSGEVVELEDTRNIIDVSLPTEVVLNDKDSGSITLRDYQLESVVKGLESTRGVINIATNGGKTEIACGIIKSILPFLKEGERIVFFTHSKEIFNQSHKRIEERLGIKIGRVGDGKWEEEQITIAMIPTIQKYIKKPKTLPKTKKVKELQESLELFQIGSMSGKEGYREKHKNATKLLKEIEKEQWSKINDSMDKTKKFLSSTVAFIADEVHHASSDTWYKVFMSLNNAYFRFGLTGTVDESDEINLKRLYGCTGRIITRVSNDYLIDKGYSAKPTIYMMDMSEVGLISQKGYADARRLGIILNEVRNQTFVEKALERANSGKQCLIIVNETEHGNILSDMLGDKGIDFDFIHGDCTTRHRETSLESFKVGDLRILIATTILDEGVDISGINCLFLAAGGKSMRQSLQRIGRGLRKKDDGSGIEVYDSLDYFNEYLVNHTLERYKTYEDEGFDIVKLD